MREALEIDKLPELQVPSSYPPPQPLQGTPGKGETSDPFFIVPDHDAHKLANWFQVSPFPESKLRPQTRGHRSRF